MTTNEFYEKKWRDVNADQLLEEGEQPTQMVNHNPMYFITNRGRVISLYGKEPKVLNQYYGYSKNAKSGGNHNRPRVELSINGERKIFYVHRLMTDYFPSDVSSFITSPSEPTEIHHINPDAPEDQLNHPSNLLVTNAEPHKLITSLERTEEPTQEQSEKIMKQMAGLDLGSAVLLQYKDAETGEVKGVTIERLKGISGHIRFDKNSITEIRADVLLWLCHILGCQVSDIVGPGTKITKPKE